MVHFLGHYYEPGAFWGVVTAAAACLIGGILTWYFAWRYYKKQKREADELAEEQNTKLDRLQTQVGRMTEYLDGLPKSEPAVRKSFELGRTAMDACKWDEAIRHLREAMKEAKGTELVALFNLIATCHYELGRLDDAFRDLKESAQLAEQFGDNLGKAKALNNIGVIIGEKGEPDKALKYHEEALAIDRELGYQQGAVCALGNMGLIYRDKGEPDRALANFNEALVVSRGSGWREGEAKALRSIGNLYRDKGEPDRALKYLAEARLVLSAIGARPSVNVATENLRPLLGQMGRKRFVAGCVQAGMPKADALKLADGLTRR